MAYQLTPAALGAMAAIQRTHRLFWPTFAGLLLLQCLPFLLTTTPALLDYPNHLARVYILGHWATDPLLHAYYQPNWAALPNLAFDGLALALNTVLPIYLAGSAGLLIAVLLLATGVVAISAVLYGRPRPFCLVGFLFVFSQPFQWGFINLTLGFGFGLVLWGVAAWLRLGSWTWQRTLAWSVPFALLLFFAHLFAFGSYAVVTFAIELARIKDWRWRALAGQWRAALAWGAQFVLPAAVFLFLSPTPLSVSTTRYGSLLDRFRSLPLAPVRNYSDAVDIVTVLAVGLLVVGGLWTRRLVIAREMRFALAGLALLCVAIPHSLASSESAEIRLPVILMLLLAASGDWRGRARGAMMAGALCLALLFTVRIGVTVQAFAQGDRFVAALKEALAGLPRGVRVASVLVTSPERHRMEAEWQHALCYEVIDKSALVPSIFTFAGQQPLLLGPAWRDRAFPPLHYLSRPNQALAASRFAELEYVVVINQETLKTPLPPELEFVRGGPHFRVYRVAGG